MKMSLGVTANQRRNGALLAYIANKVPGINLRKLLKIIYLIDEKFITLRGFPLTWFDYYVWVKGPVAPEVYDIKNSNKYFADFVKAERSADNKVIVTPLFAIDQNPTGPFGELSEYDISIIDEELRKYGDKSADWLTDQTHTPDALWSKAKRANNVEFVNGKSDCKMDLTELISTNPDFLDIYEDAEWNMVFQARLNGYKS